VGSFAFWSYNAPTSFQNLINDIFRPYLRNFILVLFDDILIYIKTWADHIRCIDITLTIYAIMLYFLLKRNVALERHM